MMINIFMTKGFCIVPCQEDGGDCFVSKMHLDGIRVTIEDGCKHTELCVKAQNKINIKQQSKGGVS